MKDRRRIYGSFSVGYARYARPVIVLGSNQVTNMSTENQPVSRRVALFWCITLFAISYGIFTYSPESRPSWPTAVAYLTSLLAFGAFLEFFKKRGSTGLKRRSVEDEPETKVKPAVLKELLSHADRVNDYFVNAIKVWIFAQEEPARKAALSAAKVAAHLQRQSMVNYLLTMSADLSKEMGDGAALICRMLEELASEIGEKDWTVTDATLDRVELAKMDKEFADAFGPSGS
jgi:hypothetical protein